MKFRAISGAAHPPTQSADAPSKASDQNAVFGHRQCDRNTDKIHSQLQATASSKNNETGADPTCIAMRSVCSASAESFEEVSLSDEEHKEDVTPQQALAKAIYNGDTGFVRAALKHDSSIANQSLPVANTNGTAPALYQAALTGHADIVRELLAAGADATTKLSHDLATPLHIAAYLGHRAATKVLLEHARKATDQTGIINAATKDGATPLFFAAEQGHHEIVAELINAGANPKASVGNHKPNGNLTPLHIAAEKGNLEVIKALLDSEFKNFRIDTRCSQNATPLHWAAQSGHTDVVSYLLDSGANAFATFDNGKTALSEAVNMNSLEMVNAVAKKQGAVLINSTNSKALVNPLRLALEKGNPAMVLKLLEVGQLSMNAQVGNSKKTPLYLAAEYGHLELAKALVDNGADVNLSYFSTAGMTPLSIATKKGNKELANFLLEQGAQKSTHYYFANAQSKASEIHINVKQKFATFHKIPRVAPEETNTPQCSGINSENARETTPFMTPIDEVNLADFKPLYETLHENNETSRTPKIE